MDFQTGDYADEMKRVVADLAHSLAVAAATGSAWERECQRLDAELAAARQEIDALE